MSALHGTRVPDARSLFAAAREDGPAASERDAVYRKIALATGVATSTAAAATALSLAPSAGCTAGTAAAVAETATAASATAAKAAATGTSLGLKLLALGAVLGAVSTALGVVLAVTVVTPDARHGAAGRSATSGVTTVAPATVGGGAHLAQPATRRRDVDDGDADESKANANADANANANANADAKANANADADAKANASAEAKAKAKADADAKVGAGAKVSAGADGDANGAASELAEEARLVTAARSALMAGDAARALSLVQATRKLGARALEPEELGLEARALRAMGRADDAAATELVLKRRYPEHALAR